MILLLDANNLCHRLWHFNTTKQRKETGNPEAIADLDDCLDWFMIHLDHVRDYMHRADPESRLVCVFDSTKRSFRSKLYKEYKSQRTRIQGVRELVQAAGGAVKLSDDWLCMVSPDGFEADDLIASIAAQSTERVLIHSPDKDFNQCLEKGRVSIIKRAPIREIEPNDAEIRLFLGSELAPVFYTADNFEDDFGFPVGRWVEYQCLVGDTADNVEGARYVGPVAAKTLIQHFPANGMDELEYGMLCVNKYLHKGQAAYWEDFIKRLPLLRSLFTLRTNIPFTLHEELTT